MSQDKSNSVVSSLIEEEINRHRDTFVGFCRAAWQTRSDPRTSKAAILEETFSAAQLAWHTAAATVLAKMSARLGAGNTYLGRSTRRLQDLSARVLAMSTEDQRLLAEWNAVQRADRNYSALLDEFRALSIARSKDNAPLVKQQQVLVEQMRGLLGRCPPGQKKAGCETSDREREAIGRQLAELSKATAVGADQTMEVHRRMEAAEKELPGDQAFTDRGAALLNEMDRTERANIEAHQQIAASFPDLRGALRSQSAVGDPSPGAAQAGRGLDRRAHRLGQKLCLGIDPRTRGVGRDRRQRKYAS